jgi:DNA repair protein RadC
MLSIKELQVHERPRERMLQKGPKYLTDLELLQTIIGSGTKGFKVCHLSEQVLKIINDKNDLLTVECLQKIPGIGAAKATLICACLEFARRRIRPEGIKINSAEDVYPVIRHFSDHKQEHFICISLNGAHEVIKTRVVTVGLVNSTQVHPREVFAAPITDRAASIIVAHNHPSGSLQPSPEDIKVTKILNDAGKILGIKLLDHVVFSKNGYLSLKESGVM